MLLGGSMPNATVRTARTSSPSPNKSASGTSIWDCLAPSTATSSRTDRRVVMSNGSMRRRRYRIAPAPCAANTTRLPAPDNVALEVKPGVVAGTAPTRVRALAVARASNPS